MAAALNIRALGTNPNTLVKHPLTTNTAALSGPGTWCFSEDIPSPPSDKTIVVDLTGTDDLANSAALLFYCVVAQSQGAGNPTARLWGMSKAANAGAPGTVDYIGTYLATVELVPGTKSVSAGIFSADGTQHFIGQIRPTVDVSLAPPGLRILGDDLDAAAMLVLDTLGFNYLIIELANASTNYSTTKIGVIRRTL